MENLHISQHQRTLYSQLLAHIHKIYPGEEGWLAKKILNKINSFRATTEAFNQTTTQLSTTRPIWSESDVVLITYGDSIINGNEAPLKTLKAFINQHCPALFSIIHLLPFFPYSSDDGFSVINYWEVDSSLGNWSDIRSLSNDADLMVDLVINHVSRESLWFADYIADKPPGNRFFIELPKNSDVSKVTRPRSTPLLVPVNTHRGIKYLWATFSDDQLDLNFENPDVLLTFVDIFLEYIRQGARIIRLDAIAFLWKTLGTSCIHLPQTHEVVKLLRTIMDATTENGILLTETNVPNQENRSYLGNCDEAHMIYQFGLPPLLLHGFFKGTATHLNDWAKELNDLPTGCTGLNFSASHDGIGLRSLEGILSPFEIEDLVDGMHRFGGFVSLKSNEDGSTSPYEINISLFDAFQGTRRGPDQWQIQRFVCSQAIVLCLKGIPAIYIHSLLATPNHLEGVEQTGRTRSINRRKWRVDEIEPLLLQGNTPNSEVLKALQQLITARKQQPAFHPDTQQEVLDINESIFGILRHCEKHGVQYQLLALHNMTAHNQLITLKNRPDLSDHTQWKDILSGKKLDNILATQTLAPYEVLWLHPI